MFIGQNDESDVSRRHRHVLDWSVVVENCKRRDTQGRREFKKERENRGGSRRYGSQDRKTLVQRNQKRIPMTDVYGTTQSQISYVPWKKKRKKERETERQKSSGKLVSFYIEIGSSKLISSNAPPLLPMSV